MSVPERKDFLTPGLIRAARGLLNISQQDLADIAGLSLRTVAAIETQILDDGDDSSGGKSVDARRRIVLGKVRAILETACAIELTFSDGVAGEGVKLKKAMASSFQEFIKCLIEDGRKEREARLAQKQVKPPRVAGAKKKQPRRPPEK